MTSFCTERRPNMAATKWVAMVASIWIQCAGGASYTFGIYSSVLKSTQFYDQSTLDTVSVFKDIGANAGVFSGLLYTAVTSNRRRVRGGGPWVVLAVGAIQSFAGYFLIWASVSGMIYRPPVPLMCLFMFLGSQSQTFFNTANVVSAVENFADYGGTAVGIMKGFLGLSGAILIQLYETICSGDPASFILLLAISPALLSFLAMPLVKIYETSSADDKKHLDGISGISVIIATYLMIIIILKNAIGMSSWVNIITLIALLILLASPLLIVRRAHLDSVKLSLSPAHAPLIANTQPTSSSGSKFSKGDSETESGDNLASIDENLNLLQAMRSLKFWLLFLAMICGMGSGLSTINNIRQIGESLLYSSAEINSLVSLWSIWNFLGRFGAGYVSDVLLHRYGWPRPLLMVATLATMSVGHLIIASGFKGNLYIGSVIVGVCYGSQWSLMPTITSELFGVRHMGTIFNTISIASPIGSYIFSVRLIGYIYDKTASGDENICYGSHCFMISFVIMACVALFGFLVACLLYFRTRTLYRQIVVKRLGHR